LSGLQMSLHAGTHIDFPSHFISNGKSANDYDLTHFILTAEVMDESQALTAVKHMQPGEALLVRTIIPGQPSEKSGLSLELAEHCVKQGLTLVGVDQLSVDNHTRDDFPVHRILLEAGVLILENLDLSKINLGRYQLICLPIITGSTEAAPVRAVLITGCRRDTRCK